MNNNRPPIIIGENLIKIFNDGIETLDQIVGNIDSYEMFNGLSAAYLYAYTVFEGTLYKIYSKVLKAFPKKANLEYKNIDKELLFRTSRTSVVIDQLCKDFSHKFGHECFNKYIRVFNKIVGIDLTSITFPEKILDEYKRQRDGIAHRGSKIPSALIIPHIKALNLTLNLIRDKFILKYKKYTDIELTRRSCAYLFKMSDREFNECFIFNNGHVTIDKESIESFYGRLSHSETHCFLLFIANYNAGISNKFRIQDLMPRTTLTDDTIDRISYINDLFEAYPYLINR